jgi:hypothetical protein
LLLVAAGTVAAAGCGSVPPSSCTAAPSAPTTLSGADRREPAIAADGGARAVVAWESLTGGPIEAAVRNGMTWSAPAQLSTAGGRDPSAAMTPAGLAFVTWQWPVDGGGAVIQVAEREPSGAWARPVSVSAPGTRARRPQIGTDARGGAVVAWVRDTTGEDAVVEVAERTRAGRWSAPRVLSTAGMRARRPRLAVASDRRAVLAWEERVNDRGSVAVATRLPDGAWSAPTTVSGGMESAREPDVAIGPRGDAVVVWIGEDDAGVGAFAAQNLETGLWSEPIRVGSGDDIPRELSRPERAETGPDVAMMVNGRAVAAWTLFDGGANRVQASRRQADGSWGPPIDLSRKGHESGGAQVTSVAGGAAAVAWEEVDGGLLRVRSARVGADGAPGRCTDLAGGLAEYASVRLAGGSAPTATFVNLNRGRVEAVTLP